MNTNPIHISFRPLTINDFPLLHRWLNEPEVARWYREDGLGHPSLEFVIKKWTPRVNGADPTKVFIICYNGKPIGSIQCALYDNNPEWKKAYGFADNLAGIDIFIGEENYLHKGLGSVIIRKFLCDIVFVVYDVNACTLDPEPENKIAIRAYEKAGFRSIRTVWNPIDNSWAYLMMIERNTVCPPISVL